MQRRSSRWGRRRSPRVEDEQDVLELQQSQRRGEELDPEEGKPGNQEWRRMAERNESYGRFLSSVTEVKLLLYRAKEGESLVVFAREERSGVERCSGGREMSRGGARGGF